MLYPVLVLLLACRACGQIVVQASSLVSPVEWREMERQLYERGVPIVPKGSVLRWTQELWSHDNQWLPFPTDSWVIAPETLAVPASGLGKFGCCGVMPVKTDSGYVKNQLCTCGESIGWINTDCLAAEFVALDPGAIEAASD